MAPIDVLLHVHTEESPIRGETPLLLTGHSPAVVRLRADLSAATTAARVLFAAEAGLEVADLAAQVHDWSRSTGPFVRLDCGAAEPPIVEQELFGTAASSAAELEAVDGRSALVRAAGGSLFIGEVTELSAGAQARLSRIARDGEVLIEGQPQRLDVRLLASAGPGFEHDVEEGRLRRDLVRYIGRTRVVVPALRQRAEDLPILVEHLVVGSCAEAGVGVKAVTQPAMTLLAAMPWRGNLQELRLAVERLTATVDGPVIQLEDVLRHVRFDGNLLPNGPSGSLRDAREQFERDYVTLVLRHHQWRVSEAARTLGIQRTNLYRKARQLGIAVTRPAGRP